MMVKQLSVKQLSVVGYSKYAAGAIATHSSGRKNIDLNPSTQPSLDLAINWHFDKYN